MPHADRGVDRTQRGREIEAAPPGLGIGAGSAEVASALAQQVLEVDVDELGADGGDEAHRAQDERRGERRAGGGDVAAMDAALRAGIGHERGPNVDAGGEQIEPRAERGERRPPIPRVGRADLDAQAQRRVCGRILGPPTVAEAPVAARHDRHAAVRDRVEQRQTLEPARQIARKRQVDGAGAEPRGVEHGRRHVERRGVARVTGRDLDRHDPAPEVGPAVPAAHAGDAERIEVRPVVRARGRDARDRRAVAVKVARRAVGHHVARPGDARHAARQRGGELGVIGIDAGVGDREQHVVPAHRGAPRRWCADVGAARAVVRPPLAPVLEPPLPPVAKQGIVREQRVGRHRSRGWRRERVAPHLRRARRVSLRPCHRGVARQRVERPLRGQRVPRPEQPRARGIEIECARNRERRLRRGAGRRGGRQAIAETRDRLEAEPGEALGERRRGGRARTRREHHDQLARHGRRAGATGAERGGDEKGEGGRGEQRAHVGSGAGEVAGAPGARERR